MLRHFRMFGAMRIHISRARHGSTRDAQPIFGGILTRLTLVVRGERDGGHGRGHGTGIKNVRTVKFRVNCETGLAVLVADNNIEDVVVVVTGHGEMRMSEIERSEPRVAEWGEVQMGEV